MKAKWLRAQAHELGCLGSNPVSVAFGNRKLCEFPHL